MGKSSGLLLWVATTLLIASDASAQHSLAKETTLLSDIAKLESVWTAAGAQVIRSEPRLLTRGALFPLQPAAQSQSSAERGCTTLVVIGDVTATFVLRAAGDETHGLGHQSQAGIGLIQRCGARRDQLASAFIELRSPRSVFEVLTVTSRGTLPKVEAILPHRNVGPSAPNMSLGPRPSFGSPVERLRAFRDRQERRGGRLDAPELLSSSPNGTARSVKRLGPGCYAALAVSAAEWKQRSVPDIDLQIHNAASGELLTEDVTESADAAGSFCLSEPTAVSLGASGLRGRAAYLVLARYTLPAGLPERLRPAGRSALAHALMTNRVPALEGLPVASAIGVVGTTFVPIEVTPGKCYIVGVAANQGNASSFRLHIGDGLQEAIGSNPKGGGALVSFCARERHHAVVQVDARGRRLTWYVGVWAVAGLPLGVE